uniref:Uncharacterized protein n=1 Tax=Cacopsylla melanoneura TaxID=428564 RepID=A0A8D9AGV1_9HEMI
MTVFLFSLRNNNSRDFSPDDTMRAHPNKPCGMFNVRFLGLIIVLETGSIFWGTKNYRLRFRKKMNGKVLKLATNFLRPLFRPQRKYLVLLSYHPVDWLFTKDHPVDHKYFK